MKPTIIAILATLLLASCTKYRYDVTYQKCDGSTGSFSYNGTTSPRYWNTVFPPELYMHKIDKTIRNVCDFEYSKTAITQ